MPDTTPTLRDRIRRAICEASGFTWLPDELLEPDEYGEHADAVLAVLPASAPAVPADRATDRRDRYAAALARVLLDSAGRLIPNHIAETAQAVSHSANAVMAVADAEQAALRAEVNRLRADRATVLRETIATVEALPVPDTSPGWALGAAWALDQIRRLADEAQPTELGTVTADQPDEADAVETVCKCGHPRKRHTLLSGTYAHCRWTYTEAGRGKCFCGMYRPTADQAATAVTEALCGNTVGVSGLYYRPCARPAGHPEAYCRDATGDHLFLPATATPGATPAEALAAAEKACSTWRLIAEAQHGHNTAPGPAAAEEPQP